MDSIIDSAIGMASRLASTIPTLSSTKDEQQQSTTTNDIMNHLLTNLTTPQSLSDILTLTIIVIVALELLSKLVYHIPPKVSSSNNKGIPVRGKHLDNFTYKDYLFIGINKCMTGIFVYCYFGYLWSVRKLDDHEEHGDHDSHKEEEDAFGQHNCCNGGSGIWSFTDLSFTNTILPIPILFITYDFFYTLLHWFLHIKSIYTYIHKHHHFQKAPSRANIDAVNVHPIEFFLGEFNHVWVLHLVVKGMPLVGYHGMDVSWLGALLFIGIGGALAGLNHTRHDVVASIPSLTTSSSSSDDKEGEEKKDTTKKKGWTIFDSKHHDVHHRIPQSNYGQYTVFWDRIFGTFREYNEDDRVNPACQLDPLTGKTKKE